MTKTTSRRLPITLKECLMEALTLKDLPRAGWQRVGVRSPESVAAHSWGVAWLVLALCPAELDRERALAMAVIHDLPEVRTGDVTPHDDVTPDAKRRAERQTLTELVTSLPHGAALVALWAEADAGTSPEGRFVRACDKLDMALQAERYQGEQGVDTEQFVASALASLDETTRRVLDM